MADMSLCMTINRVAHGKYQGYCFFQTIFVIKKLGLKYRIIAFKSFLHET